MIRNSSVICVFNANVLSSIQSASRTREAEAQSSLFFFSFKGRVFIPKEKPVETRKEEKVTLDPELEEALASASDTELYDLAGEFSGMAHVPHVIPRHALTAPVQTCELLVGQSNSSPTISIRLELVVSKPCFSPFSCLDDSHPTRLL